MAYIGMRKPVFAPITSRTDGSAITYGTPLVIGTAVSANLTPETADGADYGDDIRVNADGGMIGYSLTLETNDISKEARAACLGWQAVSSGTPSAVTQYKVTDAQPPEGGLGWIRVKLPAKSTQRVYEAFFCHCLQFTSGGENASTKERQIAYNHPTMNGTGMGVELDSSGEVRFYDWMEFATFAAAQTWIYAQFGTTPPA